MPEQSFTNPYTGTEDIINIPPEYSDDPAASSDWYRTVYLPYQDSGLEEASKNPEHPWSIVPDALLRGFYAFGKHANVAQIKMGWDSPEHAAEEIKHYQDALLKLPYSENTQNYLTNLSEIDSEEGFWSSTGAFLNATLLEKGGMEGLWDVIWESMGVFLPTIATAVVSGELTRKFVEKRFPGVKPIMAMMGVYGLGSFSTEYGADVLEHLDDYLINELGIPEGISNNDAVVDVFKDKYKMAELEAHAVKRGLPIGLMDMASLGIAGKLFSAVGGTVKNAQKLIKATDKARKAGVPLRGPVRPGMARQAGAIATEALAVQPFMGGMGEYLGQKAAGDKVDWPDVLLEGVAEMGPGTVETALGISIVRNRENKIHKIAE